MITRKTIFILGSAVFVIVLTFLAYFFFYRPRFENKKLVNPQCPKELNVIMADPEEFTYTSDNIKKVVGSINLDPKFVKGIQYDLLGFKGGSGFSASLFGEIPNKDLVARSGWKTMNVDAKKIPVSFSLEPQFSETINKNNILGIYMKAVCKDGSTSGETDIHLLRHPFPKLYFVGSSNPNKIKYFK